MSAIVLFIYLLHINLSCEIFTLSSPAEVSVLVLSKSKLSNTCKQSLCAEVNYIIIIILLTEQFVVLLHRIDTVPPNANIKKECAWQN